MALRFYTSRPKLLLDAVYAAIDEGRIDTWAYDQDGDFSHTPVQWHGLAWLSPIVNEDHLLVGILPPADSKVSVLAYSIYHGRFVEMMLNHFDRMFDRVESTALAQTPDVVASH